MFRFQDAVPVHVHGRCNVAMAHKFLLNTNRSARFVQERTVRVSECVPTESSNPDIFAFRFENLVLNDACVVATACDVRREDESFSLGAFPIFQNG